MLVLTALETIFSQIAPLRDDYDNDSVNAALAVEIMEGLAAALYPDMKVQKVALPLVVKAEMMVCNSRHDCE